MTKANRSPGIHAASALTGEGVESLLAAISETLSDARHDATLTLPFAEGRKRAWLYDQGVVTAEAETEAGHRLTVRWTARQEKAFRGL